MLSEEEARKRVRDFDRLNLPFCLHEKPNPKKGKSDIVKLYYEFQCVRKCKHDQKRKGRDCLVMAKRALLKLTAEGYF
jgi:hypothetical protein